MEFDQSKWEIVVMWSLNRLGGLFGAFFSSYYLYGNLGVAPPRWGQGAEISSKKLV